MLSAGAVTSFTLNGTTYKYLKPDPVHPPEICHSGTYGDYPKVLAALPLVTVGILAVYALANRWNPSQVILS